MGAFNWILIDATCPACQMSVTMRCQTHAASDYGGDDTGRFHDREYRLGERMARWPKDDRRYDDWNHPEDMDGPGENQERTYAHCPSCEAQLIAVIAFEDLVAMRVLDVSLDDDRSHD
ncbi:MAG: hypothetical protein RL885_24850 [Planctomycetota bacterium]